MKILLADDHEVVRRGLRQMLGEELEGAEFGEAGSVAETLEQLRREPWDLLVLDIHMPGRSGLDVLGELQGDPRAPRVLVLSMAPEELYAVRALKKGAAAYLSKQGVAAELVAAVRKVLAGGRFVTAALAEKIVDGLLTDGGEEPVSRLSSRELQVLRLIATGKRVKEVARELSLSEKTVFTYRERLRAKLGVHTDVELARFALSHELVE